MTTHNRPLIPDDIPTNGATPNPWWTNAVVYQIYPRSFQDSNGDGIGDIRGITSRLGYIADLGVDVIWLSPVYQSPQDDNGYDISDYQSIESLFGTLEDLDELLAAAHGLGLKVLMDLVVNHTSDEHAWFEASKNKNDPHADWYWWRPARKGAEPGSPGAEPNKWGSYFGGSAWQYCPERGEYFLHQYSKKQPDLNWENPKVRRAVYDMMNWWMDHGIDGFRMDVITQISKVIDESGKLPGESDSLIVDLPAGPEGYSSPFPFCSDGPRMDEFLSEMRREVFHGRQGFMTVGEAPGVVPERGAHISDPANGELDMLFLFDHLSEDVQRSKWELAPFNMPSLRRKFAKQQEAVSKAGWASLFFCNHDQPRALSHWGDDTGERERVHSAKALGLLLHMHRGTPYIYQGEELGMTNAHFTSLDQYRDLESLNAFRQRVEETGVQSRESMMDALASVGRDNSRTPMQWDSSRYAGFTSEQASAEPWIEVNPNHVKINAAEQCKDPNSIFSFYKKLIALRHDNPLVSAGAFSLVDGSDEHMYSFTRTLVGRQLLVMVNLSGEAVAVPEECSRLMAGDVHESQILIATLGAEHAVSSISTGELAAWEGVVVKL